MATVAASVQLPSYLSHIASTADPSRAHAARLLAKVDPARLVVRLQTAIATRSTRAMKELASDMKQLEQVFAELTHAGYDVRKAKREFESLQDFVTAQLTYYAPTAHYSPSSSSSSSSSSSRTSHDYARHHESHRTIREPLQPTTMHNAGSPPRHSDVYYQTHSRSSSTSSPPRQHSPPKTLRFSPEAIVYEVPRYHHSTPPPIDRPSCKPRSSREH